MELINFLIDRFYLSVPLLVVIILLFISSSKKGGLKISSQKLLKKYPIIVNQNLGKNVEIDSGSVGMLIDGVEIQSLKSLLYC